MLNLKASLGVTFTDWTADSPCSLPGAVAAGSWSGVTCDGTGKVLGIVLNSQMLTGSIHSDISKLSTLTSLDLQSNLLQGRLDSFTTNIKAPLVLKELHPCSHWAMLKLSYTAQHIHFTYSALFTHRLPLPQLPVNLLNPLCPPVHLPPSAVLQHSAIQLSVWTVPLHAPRPHHPLQAVSALPPSTFCCLPSASPSRILQSIYLTSFLLPHSLLSPLPSPPPHTSSVAYNYLTGSFPTVPASAKSLDVQSNFLSGAFPTNALTYCAATTNCLTDANNCASLGVSQRAGSDCAICGTSFGQGTLCGGVACLVNTTGVTAPPTATSPLRNLYCMPVALDTNSSECRPAPNMHTTPDLCSLPSLPTFPTHPTPRARPHATTTAPHLLSSPPTATTVVLQPKALKSSSVPLATTVGACTVEGQTPAPGSWTGVYCNSAGAVVALLLPNQKLSGSLSTDITKLTALTALCVSLSAPIHVHPRPSPPIHAHSRPCKPAFTSLMPPPRFNAALDCKCLFGSRYCLPLVHNAASTP
ncbi:unnamed protein product [Closterium sp. NIES-54]